MATEPVVETERLRMRELTEDDAEFVFRLLPDPEVMEGIGYRGVETLEDARRFIRRGPWTNQPRPGLGHFLVEEKASGEPTGTCGLLYRDNLDVIDVGFAFLPEFWGRGYATEAAGAMLDHGRRTLGIERIVGLTSPDNAGSIRVLEKLGMSFEREVKMSEDDPGSVLYA